MSNKVEETIEELKSDLALIDEMVTVGYTIADAIREGCNKTEKTAGWGDGSTACALSAAYMAAKARNIL